MNLTENILPDLLVYSCLLTGVWLSIKTGKLTPPAAFCGGIIGLILYETTGFSGLIMLVSFFTIGTLATIWSSKKKAAIKTGYEHGVKRDIGQVLANAGIPAIIALFIFIYPEQKSILQLMIAASFSAATADTVSSELGMIYGKRFYHILHWKPDKKGLDGVISTEGTLLGILGSAFIALLFIMLQRTNITSFGIIVLAGTIGNICDSIMGATLERKQHLSNNMVNAFNTLAGALAALLMIQYG
ncbi:MAG: DUF92 domain-containing protein [Sphingobacteriaceae bacterium]